MALIKSVSGIRGTIGGLPGNNLTPIDIVSFVSAYGSFLKNDFQKPVVVIGRDGRISGEMVKTLVISTLQSMGIDVIDLEYSTTPTVEMYVRSAGASGGIIITASHNPPSYNGFKLKGSFGGPLQPSLVAEIEDLIPEKCTVNYASIDISTLEANGSLTYVDLETMYCDHVEANFDLDAIKKSGLNLAFDAMYGSGQNVMKRLMPDLTFLHCDYNPSFMGQAPEPIHKNLTEFSNLIKNSGKIDSGLVTDGDADRLGFYDGKGNFVDSHHIILLLIHYLHNYKC